MELCQARQASRRQHPCDGVPVHAQLFGDRSDPPVFGVVIAQDLRLNVRGMVTVRSSSIVPRTLAAPQKVTANKLRTATAAAMAGPSRQAGSASRGCGRHGHCLVLWQQTIRLIRWGTL